jgi:formamidopyrimidine-DNA glycosylase
MPELPEVESQARDLRKYLLNRPIKEVWVGWKKTVARMGPDQFKRGMIGRRVIKIDRRGKFIIMQLDNDMVLVSHFRMTGHFRIAPAAASKSVREWYIYPPDRFTRVAFRLDKGDILHYSDIRKFGRLWLISKSELVTLPELRELGPEPLDKKFTAQEFLKCVRPFKGMIKPTLLNQSCVAGIGNIYADESLFDAGIHPKTRLEKVSDKELQLLYRMIRTNLSEAVKHRGSSVGEFLNMKGDHGDHGLFLRVYGRKGKPCLRRRSGIKCSGNVKRIVVGQRGTHVCPVCQKIKR